MFAFLHRLLRHQSAAIEAGELPVESFHRARRRVVEVSVFVIIKERRGRQHRLPDGPRKTSDVGPHRRISLPDYVSNVQVLRRTDVLLERRVLRASNATVRLQLLHDGRLRSSFEYAIRCSNRRLRQVHLVVHIIVACFFGAIYAAVANNVMSMVVCAGLSIRFPRLRNSNYSPSLFLFYQSRCICFPFPPRRSVEEPFELRVVRTPYLCNTCLNIKRLAVTSSQLIFLLLSYDDTRMYERIFIIIFFSFATT